MHKRSLLLVLPMVAVMAFSSLAFQSPTFLPLCLKGAPPSPTATATGTPTPSLTPTATPISTRTPTATQTTAPVHSGDVRVDWDCCQVDAPGNENENLTKEYVCFVNRDTVAVNMGGWHVQDEVTHDYTFPAFTLAPGARVRLRTGSGTDTTTDLYWGEGQAVWNNGGDTIYLYDGGWNLIDSYTY